MKTEDKVVSLELAKRMEKLGWLYESDRYWCGSGWIMTGHPQSKTSILAPDAIEIGERLPSVTFNKCRCFLHIQKEWDLWNPYYQHSILEDGKFVQDFAIPPSGIVEKSLSEALGKMWCYLKEKKLI